MMQSMPPTTKQSEGIGFIVEKLLNDFKNDNDKNDKDKKIHKLANNGFRVAEYQIKTDQEKDGELIHCPVMPADKAFYF